MIKKRKIDIFLVFILVLSAALNLYGIWNNDTDNAYYTAAVESMTQSFHNFFYASFDPAGFVTVDKPPVALWIQTLFALVFGVHGWSVVLPEAIAEVISVALLYFPLAKRRLEFQLLLWRVRRLPLRSVIQTTSTAFSSFA